MGNAAAHFDRPTSDTGVKIAWNLKRERTDRCDGTAGVGKSSPLVANGRAGVAGAVTGELQQKIL